MQEKPEVKDKENAVPLQFRGGCIEFDNVHFGLELLLLASIYSTALEYLQFSLCSLYLCFVLFVGISLIHVGGVLYVASHKQSNLEASCQLLVLFFYLMFCILFCGPQDLTTFCKKNLCNINQAF